MTMAVAKKKSLFRETLKSVQATVQEWWPWVLVFGLFFAALQICIMQTLTHSPMMQFIQQHPEVQSDPNFSKTHPELFKQYTATTQNFVQECALGLVPYLLAILLVDALAIYVFVVIVVNYLRPQAKLRHNFSDFFYWFRKSLWKYFRPILWCFIPIIGAFFYVRSIVRYAVVSPLAVLQQGEELKTSWDLTKGNWWRIFGNQLLLAIAMWLISVVIVQILTFLALLLTGGHKTSAVLDIASFVQGMMMAVAAVASAAFSCAVYDVFSGEFTQNKTADSSEIVP